MKLFSYSLPSLSAAVLLSFMAQSCGTGSGDLSRSDLDQYIELETEINQKALAMNEGESVYVDFSDGMNAAYGNNTSKEALRKIINVFTGAEGQASFFSLADSKITPLELSQTEIYNAIMSGKNYTLPRAPIEKTLEMIVDKKQPALLITDFEEYNGGVIQQQSYAKTYFIKWLTMGYNIIFYKIDYKEGSKEKHLYFTIFDSAANELGAKVEQALSGFIGNGVDRFTLGGAEYSFDMKTSYLSSTQGGNYHNSKGEDLVSAVLENGKGEDWTAYNMKTQYYPFGDNYSSVISNGKAMQEEGIEPADRFKHLISNIFVNFSNQDGYSIEGIEAKVYDVNDRLLKFVEARGESEKEGVEFSMPESLPDAKEVKDMFVAELQPDESNPGWYEITFDFNPLFNGEVPATMSAEGDLLKAEIVISKATPRLELIDAFFSWPGNTSLAESVRNTLNDKGVNPEGRAVVTYYIRKI